MNLKGFGKNTLIYSIGNVGLRAASFLLIPIYTHALSVREFGLLATLLLTVQLMVLFMSVGLQSSIVRFLKEHEQTGRVAELLGCGLALGFTACLLVSGATLLFLRSFFANMLHTEHVTTLLALSCVVATLQSFSRQLLSYYRARNEAKKYTILGFISAVVLILANVVCLYGLHLGVKGALYSQALAYGLVLVLALPPIVGKTGIAYSSKLVCRLFRFGFPLVFSNSTWLVMGGSAIYFLSYFSSLESAGIYSLGHKFVQITSIVLLLPFQLAYEPIVFANIGHPQLRQNIAKLLTYFVVAFAFTAFLILTGTKLVLPLAAPPEYASAYLVVLFLLPAMIFEGIYFFGATLLQIENKTHIEGIIAVCFLLVSLSLNFLLIPNLGWQGAVVATAISYCAAAMTVLALGLKIFPVRLEVKRLTMATACVVLLAFFFFAAKNLGGFLFAGLNLLTFVLCVFLMFRTKFFSSEELSFLRRFRNNLLLRGMS